MKRSLFALFGLLLVLTGLVGCGSKGTEAETSTAPTASNPQATPGTEAARGRSLRVSKDAGAAAEGK